jgi:chorismate mutase
MKSDRLKLLRSRIDAIDVRIVDLLVKRAGYAEEIGLTKEAAGAPVKDSVREKRVIGRVRAEARKPLAKDSVERIYKAILKESRGMQSKIKGKGA